MSKPSEGNYSDSYFSKRKPYAVDYAVIADSLVKLLQPKSALDLGCGNGLLMAPLAARGVAVIGYERAKEAMPHTDPSVRDRIVWRSFLDPDSAPPPADLVCCVEVAEHLDRSLSEALVALVANRAERWVYWSAANPQQKGEGHVNCQSQFYWLEKFHRRGFQIAWEESRQFFLMTANLTKTTWLHHNGLLLQRQET